jgi:hypothetical protein
MNMNVSDISGQIDPTVLAAVVSRRWQEARSYYAPRSALEAAWRLKSSSAALEMCWSRRTSFVVSLCPPPALKTALAGTE